MSDEPETSADVAEDLLARCIEGDVLNLAIVVMDNYGNIEVMTALAGADDGAEMALALAEVMGIEQGRLR